MSDESNAIEALKNAWKGAIAASDRVRDLAASVQGLPAATPLADLDLESYHAATMAQANAIMALRGLIDELKRRRGHHAA
jgi:hypothetical protein